MFRDLCCWLFLYLILTGTTSVMGQDLSYSIFFGNKTVGKLEASQSVHDEKRTINVHSDAQFSLFWKDYQRTTHFRLEYRGVQLLNSYVESRFNGELEDSTITRVNEDHYLGFQYPDKKLKIPKEWVTWTTSNLFFEEPLGVDSVYSERFLILCKLENDGDHRYSLHVPGGVVNHYIYEEGNLAEIIIERTWYNIRVRNDAMLSSAE